MDIRVENKPHGTVFYCGFSKEALDKVAEKLYESVLNEITKCQDQQTRKLKKS